MPKEEIKNIEYGTGVFEVVQASIVEITFEAPIVKPTDNLIGIHSLNLQEDVSLRLKAREKKLRIMLNSEKIIPVGSYYVILLI